MLGRAGGLTVLQANGDRYSVLQGDKLRFGTVETVISYGAAQGQVQAEEVATLTDACTGSLAVEASDASASGVSPFFINQHHANNCYLAAVAYFMCVTHHPTAGYYQLTRPSSQS